MRIYFLRHTEVENPLAITLRRKSDFHLSEKGHEQAQEVGQFIIGQGIVVKRILTSPLERCVETSEIIKTKLSAEARLEVREYLNEWEKGEKSEDIAIRMRLAVKEAQDNDLFISHQDPIRVLINLLAGKSLLSADLKCALGSLYQIVLDKKQKLSGFKLLFALE